MLLLHLYHRYMKLLKFCKRGLIASVLTCIALIFSGSTLLAQQLHTFVDHDSLRVGDPVTLSIVIEGNYSLQEYPDGDAFPEDLELQNRQRFQVSATRDSIVYNLQFFSLEDMVLDRLNFQIRIDQRDTTLQSSRVPLYFKTTLAEDDDELRPFKPIFDFARSYWIWILAALLLALLGYYLFTLIKKRTQKEVFIPRPFESTPFVNPLRELETSMEQIKSQPPPMNEKEFEQFYVQLADAIRLYLKRVYDFPALEMTSGEIVRKLQELRASSDLIKKVKKVLYDADMVKFAKFNPASDQVADALKTGTDFVETARTIDSERIEYLEHQHTEKQQELKTEHEQKELERKQEFEQ